MKSSHTRMPHISHSELNQKVYMRIEAWRNRPIEHDYPYVCQATHGLRRFCRDW